MIRVYIAATLPLREEARRIAYLLSQHARIVSTWHDDLRATVAVEATLDLEQRRATANRCLAEVGDAEAFILLVGPETTRHGSFIEAGFALGGARWLFILPVLGAPPCAELLLPESGHVRHCGSDAELASWFRQHAGDRGAA